MTALAAQSTIAPAPDLPRVGIVAVSLPADSHPLRSVWLDPDTLMVGFDPARLTRDLAALIVARAVGAYEDIDGGEQL
ncbi:hypothetical protein [Kitasatospora mediocidica]|uniref:hypothetical protein n=1 Tax=Kitasatospora mediocidica TaxID=58352 RepID=UPI000560241C|nr:hypothetical protein [Kitasatospora mediocidica]